MKYQTTKLSKLNKERKQMSRNVSVISLSQTKFSTNTVELVHTFTRSIHIRTYM